MKKETTKEILRKIRTGMMILFGCGLCFFLTCTVKAEEEIPTEFTVLPAVREVVFTEDVTLMREELTAAFFGMEEEITDLTEFISDYRKTVKEPGRYRIQPRFHIEIREVTVEDGKILDYRFEITPYVSLFRVEESGTVLLEDAKLKTGGKNEFRLPVPENFYPSDRYKVAVLNGQKMNLYRENGSVPLFVDREKKTVRFQNIYGFHEMILRATHPSSALEVGVYEFVSFSAAQLLIRRSPISDIILLKDISEPDLYLCIPRGKEIDLNGKTLTVSALVILGSVLVDSSANPSPLGKIVVPKGQLLYNTGEVDFLPAYIPEDRGYRLFHINSWFTLWQEWNEEKNTNLRYVFRPCTTDNLVSDWQRIMNPESGIMIYVYFECEGANFHQMTYTFDPEYYAVFAGYSTSGLTMTFRAMQTYNEISAVSILRSEECGVSVRSAPAITRRSSE